MGEIQYEMLLSSSIRFWILIFGFIASISCCIFLLYFLLMKNELRKAMNNHVIIVILVLEAIYMIIDMPLYLNYLRHGFVSPRTAVTCVFWWLSELCLHETITILVAWASIERHFLIFHSQWMLNRRKRILIHYLPILLILIYSFSYYGFAIIFAPCENDFHFTEPWCSKPCIFENLSFSIYQTVINEILFTSMIIFFSLTLLIRVIWQRNVQLHQPLQWRKHRKLTIQIIALASPYLFFHLPEMMIYLIKPFDSQSEFGITFEMYIDYVGYLPELFLPFICLAGIYPKPWRRRNRIFIEPVLVRTTVKN